MKSTLVSISALLVAMVSIQSGATLAKQLLPQLGASGTTFLRCGIATFLLFAVWKPWKERMPRSGLYALLIYGASLGFMNFLFYQALERIPLGLAVAFEFVGPLAVSLLSSRRARDLIWVVLAAFGIALLLPLRIQSDSLDPLGVVYALAAGGCWAIYILSGQKAGASLHTGRTTAWGMLIATGVVLPFGIVEVGTKFFDIKLLPLAFVVAVMSSAVPYTLEMFVLKRLPPRTFGILMSLEPAVAAQSGAFFLGEKLSSFQWLAILCLITASVGSSFGLKQRDELVLEY
jgi:inner membrane transporter RhtA